MRRLTVLASSDPPSRRRGGRASARLSLKILVSEIKLKSNFSESENPQRVDVLRLAHRLGRRREGGRHDDAS